MPPVSVTLPPELGRIKTGVKWLTLLSPPSRLHYERVGFQFKGFWSYFWKIQWKLDAGSCSSSICMKCPDSFFPLFPPKQKKKRAPHGECLPI